MRHYVIVVLLMALASWSTSTAQEQANVIRLPRPDTSGGKPLMQTLKDRHSSRSFDSRRLPDQMLADLLWAAFGVNRPDGHRTAPSARNSQEMYIYAVMEDGVYLYDAPAHALRRVLAGDFRAKTGTQDFVAKAPLNLVYVADMTKVGARTDEDRILYTGADCGVIAENVYLYCASAGLSVVVRASIDKPACAAALHLAENQRIILAQTVGFPPE